MWLTLPRSWSRRRQGGGRCDCRESTAGSAWKLARGSQETDRLRSDVLVVSAHTEPSGCSPPCAAGTLVGSRPAHYGPAVGVSTVGLRRIPAAGDARSPKCKPHAAASRPPSHPPASAPERCEAGGFAGGCGVSCRADRTSARGRLRQHHATSRAAVRPRAPGCS